MAEWEFIYWNRYYAVQQQTQELADKAAAARLGR